MDAGGKKARIYVDLDALLDTRLGTIAKINQEIAAELATSDDYRNRVIDQFAGIDTEAFKREYSTRDEETLSLSMMSEAVAFIGSLIKDLFLQSKATPFYDAVTLTINTAPYVLDDETKSEIGAAVAHWTLGLAAIDLVCISESDLTPTRVVSEWDIMVKYEYDSWLSCQTPALEKTRMFDIQLFAPALYAVMPTDKDISEAVKLFDSAFAATEKLASPLINLKLMPVSMFSIIKP